MSAGVNEIYHEVAESQLNQPQTTAANGKVRLLPAATMESLQAQRDDPLITTFDNRQQQYRGSVLSGISDSSHTT